MEWITTVRKDAWVRVQDLFELRVIELPGEPVLHHLVARDRTGSMHTLLEADRDACIRTAERIRGVVG